MDLTTLRTISTSLPLSYVPSTGVTGGAQSSNARYRIHVTATCVIDGGINPFSNSHCPLRQLDSTAQCYHYPFGTRNQAIHFSAICNSRAMVIIKSCCSYTCGYNVGIYVSISFIGFLCHSTDNVVMPFLVCHRALPMHSFHATYISLLVSQHCFIGQVKYNV